MEPPTFHGTRDETLALLEALNHHCTCAHDAEGRLVDLCAQHAWLAPAQHRPDRLGYAGLLEERLDHQRVLDGLLTFRHLRDHLLNEEDTETLQWPRRCPPDVEDTV